MVKDKGELLTKVVADAGRGTREIRVADASRIKAGDWVVLGVLNNDPDLVRKELGGLEPEASWTSILEDGVEVNERHQVARVEADRVTFVEPLFVEVDAMHGWTLREFPHLSEVGFEGLAFEGGWNSEFVHHRSAIDDGGWSIVELSRVVNSWIRDCTFRNVSRPVSVSASAATTVLDVVIEGNSGHHAVSANGGSTGVLLAGIQDKAGMFHSVGVGGGSTTGTVVWRSSYPPHTSFESHASQPRATLFDNVSGGFFAGRAGGAIKNLPNHGQHLVLWNFRETDEGEEDFRFVAADSAFWRFVPPIVVGFHGAGTTFHPEQVSWVESLGTPVEPQSLFEAQLLLRLGAVPDWIVAARQELEARGTDDRRSVMAYGRFVPEREDDFAWENDKVAFRVYGPATKGDGPVSGVDAWLKKVEYAVIDKWYAQNAQGKSYHVDHGEGYDPYHTGASRGVGGTAIWVDGTPWPAPAFHEHRVLKSGGTVVEFQLEYEWTTPLGRVAETKTISLALGDQLYRVRSAFTLDGQPAALPVAIGLSTHDAAAEVFHSAERGWISTWEVIDGKGLGTGAWLEPGLVEGVLHQRSEEKDASHVWLLTTTSAGGELDFRAGFGWQAAGEFDTSGAWNEYLDSQAARWHDRVADGVPEGAAGPSMQVPAGETK